MKIKSIRPAGTSDVFNMEVKDTHDFAVGDAGAIVHNCYDQWRYVCMARPIAPREKKLIDTDWKMPPMDPLNLFNTEQENVIPAYEKITLF